MLMGVEFRLAVQSGRVSKYRVGYVIVFDYDNPDHLDDSEILGFRE
jgi:hypothetical protein